MDKLKQYVVFTVLGCLVVLAAGWYLLVSPKREEAAALRAETDTQVAANAALVTQLQVLKAQAKALPKEQAKLAAVAARIPDNPALPALVRALVAAGQSAGIELVSVTPGPPAVVAAPAPAPVAVAPPAAAGTTTTTTTPVTRVAAANGSAGQLAVIPVTLSIAGGYFQVQQFIANLENLPRSMRISALTVAPGQNPVKKTQSSTLDGRSLLSTVTGQVFLAANRPPATAVTVPGTVAGVAAVPSVPVVPAKK